MSLIFLVSNYWIYATLIAFYLIGPVLAESKTERVDVVKHLPQPFRLSGRTLAEHKENGHGQLVRKFGKSVSEFPNYSSCTMRESTAHQSPEITKIDWTKITQIEDLEVCIFRIADLLGDAAKLETWFVTQGFSRVQSEQLPAYRFRLYSNKSKKIQIAGVWIRKEREYPFESLRLKFIVAPGSTHFAVAVLQTKGGEVLNVSIVFNRLPRFWIRGC